MRHMTGSVYGIFERPVHMYRGTTMAGIVADEAVNAPNRGFVGGYEMETVALGLPFLAAFLQPGAWGRDFTSAMDSYDHMAGMWLVGEDMPQESNRVSLHASENGSQFTTGGAENPTLTIVALALRQADYIRDQMAKGAL
jgi:hypothetical protein